MSSSFLQGWETLDLLSEGTSHEASQLGYGGSRGSSTSASHWDQGDGGGDGARDRSTAIDGSSNKIL